MNSDQAKCSDEECPIKKTCHRYMVEPGDRQSYSGFQWKRIVISRYSDIPQYGISCDGYIFYDLPGKQ